MRISNEEKNSFIKLSHQYFGLKVALYLFGSRVDDSKKGGDIDLFLESNDKIDLKTQVSFLASIERNITSRKIDLIIKTPFTKNKDIFTTAKKEGIKLC